MIFCKIQCIVSCRIYKHLNKNNIAHSGISTEGQFGSSLDSLCEKLTKGLAEEIKECWIDPQGITLNKFLGHGKKYFENFSSLFLSKVKPFQNYVLFQETLPLFGLVL